MKNLNKSQKGVLALVLLSLGFGGIAIAARFMGTVFTSFQQLYLSAGIGFLISLFIYKRSLTVNKIRRLPVKDWLIMLFRILIGYLIAGPLYRDSIVLTKISNVTFIQSLPFSAILGWLIFKEKFSFKKLLYVLVAFYGVVLIAVTDYSSLITFGKGELFSLISAVLFSLSYLARKWQSDFINDLEMTQILLFLGAVFLFITSVLLGEKFPAVNWNWILLTALFFSAFFNTINLFLINYGFRNVKAVLASNIITLEAVFALMLAFIFYRELPNLKEFIGGILIMFSVVQMNKLETKT